MARLQNNSTWSYEQALRPNLLASHLTLVSVSAPLFSKTLALQKVDPPKTLQQLRSLMDSIYHLTKFMPILAEISERLRPLLKRENTTTSNKLKWEEKHNTPFNNIKKQISKIVENKNFRRRQRNKSQK